MMSRLVTDEAVIKAIDLHTTDTPDGLVLDDDITCILEGVPTANLEAPTVTERKTGRWYINSDGYYPYCSECKNEPKSGLMTDFCPSCGADMRYKSGAVMV